jgi:serine protease
MKLLPFSMLFGFLATSAVEAESIRLVLTHSTVGQFESRQTLSGSQSVQLRQSCIPVHDRASEICVPRLENSINLEFITNSNKAIMPAFSTVELDIAGTTQEQAVAVLKETGWYQHVEVDVKISTPDTYPIPAYSMQKGGGKLKFNDVDYYAQLPYFTTFSTSVTGSQFESALSLLKNPKNKIDVIVMDSGFYLHDDLTYTSGVNFSTANSEKRDNEFIEKTSCIPHGTGVSSVIAAHSNNEVALAGIATDINLHAVRVMKCGNGYLGDVADALMWLSGQKYEGVSAYTGKPGVVNLSLGGTTSNCSNFLQQAIDAATSKGFTIVAAAGNQNIDVAGFSPANCNNVITVGAIDVNADKASFSNYGSGIDLMAQGKEVLGLCTNPTRSCYWEGTSFSAPLVSGAIALAYKENVQRPDIAKMIVKTTTNPIADPFGECAVSGCGKGLLNAEGVVAMTQAFLNDELNTISYALEGKTDCEQKWYVDYFGSKARLCQLFKLKFMGGFASSDTKFKLARFNHDAQLITANAEIVAEFDSAMPLVQDLDPSNYLYAVQVCDVTGCEDKWLKINASNALEPKSCL